MKVMKTALMTVLLGAAVGCSMRSGEAPSAPEMEEMMAAAPAEPMAVGGAAPMAPKRAMAREMSADLAEGAPMDDEAPPPPPPPQGAPEKQKPEPKKPKARMVHYNGYCKLRVTRPVDTLNAAVAIAEDAGGYVENLTSTAVTLRVPVAQFRALFAKLVDLGDVVARSITAKDVTDAYTAVKLRLKTLRASRDRLIELLAKARTEREKLTLLREIKRLTEQVDRLEMQMKTIASLASFSRITLETEPRHVNPGQGVEELVGAFRWIRNLSPFRRDVSHDSRYFELAAPTGMVDLDDKQHWSAESADGAVIWTSKRDNRPEGSTEFWINAIKQRLGPEFTDVAVSDVGEFKVLRLVDLGEAGYRYMVGVRAAGDDLEMVEIYYPTKDQEERYKEAVLEVITRGGAA